MDAFLFFIIQTGYLVNEIRKSHDLYQFDFFRNIHDTRYYKLNAL